MKKVLLTIASALTVLFAYAQPAGRRITDSFPETSYYLPFEAKGTDPNIPNPMAVLGFNFAERFVEWSDVVNYMETLAKASDRVSIHYFGKTFESRPYIQICITSPENQARLEELRLKHLELDGTGPVIINLMGSIHGNEISGVTGLLPVAYYYAASTDREVEELLKDAIIVITPGLNPDGINRFGNWVNNNSGVNHRLNPDAREYKQNQPRSRCNHWWMDCNRDWLACQFEVGQECVRMYRHWMPNVVLDLHEMGGKGKTGTYYFSPGDPKRTHHYIPQENQDLTLAISEYTAAAMESISTPYFTRKGYDDFYIGKGAAYCDIQGSIGILHEQCSTRGHVAEFENFGVWTFQQTVRNQSYASYAVTKAAYEIRSRLLDYQRSFMENTAKTAAEDKAKAWVFNTRGDNGMAWQFVSNLLTHGIDVYQDKRREDGFIVPLEQKNYYVIKCIFEDITEYSDSTFYDISTWSQSRAFNIEAKTVKKLPSLGEKIDCARFIPGDLDFNDDDAAYRFELNEYYTPYMLASLQEKGVSVKVTRGGKIIVPIEGQQIGAQELKDLIESQAKLCGVCVNGVSTREMKTYGGLSEVRKPKVGIISKGDQEAGELWYLMDYRYGMDCSVLADATSYKDYNVLFSTSALAKDKKLVKWVEEGGTLFLQREACRMVKMFSSTELVSEKGMDMGKRGVRGVVMNATVNRKDSPLFWGYSQNELALFKDNASRWSGLPEGAETLLTWQEGGYLSGCISKANISGIEKTPALFVIRYGKGVVICSQCDLNFRSYWLGTSHITANAAYFGDKL